MRTWVVHVIFGVSMGMATASARAQIAFTWPTPQDVSQGNLDPARLLQHAGTGDPLSGGFGCVRSGGLQFHEGLDLRAVARDRQGEPIDSIVAAMDGVVRYRNDDPETSSYGRYLVLEHPGASPAVFTLYAHLSAIESGIRVGAAVRRGQAIARMGHSAGGYVIPAERAHLHFEIGLLVTEEFQRWYDAQDYDSPNDHGIYNGLNLMGIDPLDYFGQLRRNAITNFRQYIQSQPVAARVRIATSRVPDFARRYPSLVDSGIPATVAGWEIDFGETGVPLRLRALPRAEVAALPAGVPVVVSANSAVLDGCACRSIADEQGAGWSVGRDLQVVLDQLFGGS